MVALTEKLNLMALLCRVGKVFLLPTCLIIKVKLIDFYGGDSLKINALKGIQKACV